MSSLAATGTFLVSPSTWLLLYTVILLVAFVCALLCAAKGRWGFLVAGLLSFGIFLVAGALASPRPGSVWSKASARRHAHR